MTYDPPSLVRGGALYAALKKHPYSTQDLETFRILANKARVISSTLLLTLYHREEMDHLLYLIKEQFEKCEWPEEDSIFRVLSEESALDVMPALIKIEGGFRLLNHAASRGYTNFVEKLVSDFGLRPDKSTLRSAIRSGNAHLVQKLLPLADASDQEPRFIELLIDSGVCNHSLDRLLWASTSSRDRPIIERLLAEGVRPSASLLHYALEVGDKSLADVLLDAGVSLDPDHRPGQGKVEGALYVTSKKGDNDLTEYVLRKGTDPNYPKALETSFQKNRIVFNTILTAYKNRYNRRVKNFGSSMLCLAIESKDTILIEELLENNADPHGFMRKGDQYVTPFGYAIMADNSNDLIMVKQFLKHGCRPSNVASYLLWSDRDPLGRRARGDRLGRWGHSSSQPRTTAFVAAIATENTKLIQLLVQNDEGIIHVPARGSFKRTALQRAAEIGSLTMVELIRNLGADIDEPPNRVLGATAVQLAAIGGFGGVLRYLIHHGADLNARGAVIGGVAAVVGAATSGCLDIVAILLNNGACRGDDGSEQFESAIKEAELNGHSHIADYLRQRQDSQRQEVSWQEPYPGDELMNFSDSD
ncbi:ankyrin repeat-containing domain protein [Xylaria digitata]|nr:ankyrin repeat-containing domain protein [Xylaria digitata]